MGYIFDGDTRIISMEPGTVVLDLKDLYSRWKDWVVASGAMYPQAFSVVGGDPIDVTEGIYITTYLFLENGWRIRPQEASHKLKVTEAVVVVASGSDPFLQTMGVYNVMIQYSQPIKSETVATGGGGGGGGGVVTSIEDAALNQIVTVGNTAGWKSGPVTVSGIMPTALSQIVASGNQAGWREVALSDPGPLLDTIEFMLEKDDVPISGATVNILIKRDSDNKYWDGLIWDVPVPAPSLTMTEYDSTYYPGLYRYTLSTTTTDEILVDISYDDSGVIRHANGSFSFSDAAVTVSGFYPGALSEIVASGNQAGWSGGGGGVTGAVTVSGITPGALSQIVASGNSANWGADTVQVTVSGVTPGALTQIVASGNQAGWSSSGSVEDLNVNLRKILRITSRTLKEVK